MIDTNVWISRVLLSDSLPARAVDKALESHDVMLSEALMDELASVLARSKFDKYVSRVDRQAFIRRVLQVGNLATVISQVADCRDPKDNMILALALDSSSHQIVSGDRDLLALDPWRRIRVVTPKAFLDSDESAPPSSPVDR